MEELLAGQSRNDMARAGGQEAIRGELRTLGAGIRAAREDEAAGLDRLGALAPVAARFGISPGEIAELTGTSRQTVLTARTQQRGAELAWTPDTKILLTLASDGPASREAVVGTVARLALHAVEVDAAFDRLCNTGSVEPAGTGVSGPNAVGYVRISAQGIAELPGRLRHEAMPASRRFTVYAEVAQDEAIVLAEAGEELFGGDTFGIVPVGTVYGMKNPEIAFHVEARNKAEAEAAAGARVRELRTRGGLPDALTHITVILPPGASEATA